MLATLISLLVMCVRVHCFFRFYIIGKSESFGSSLLIAGSKIPSMSDSVLSSVVLTVCKVRNNHMPKQSSDCTLSIKLPDAIEKVIRDWEDTVWAQFPSVSDHLTADQKGSKVTCKHFESASCAHFGVLTGMFSWSVRGGGRCCDHAFEPNGKLKVTAI